MTGPEQVLQSMKAYLKGRSSREELDAVFHSWQEESGDVRIKYSDSLCREMILLIDEAKPAGEVYYFLSAIVRLTENEIVCEELIRLLQTDERISKENRYFAYYRLKHLFFVCPALDTDRLRDLLDDLYEKIYQEYRAEISKDIGWILPEERNRDLVFVITGQILAVEHGPTKTLLDRCRVLRDTMNKEVYIINTAEVMTPYGAMDWYDPGVGNYISEYLHEDYLEYRDKRFSYIQFPQEMPKVSLINEVIRLVREERPWCILSIGAGSITADLCALAVPVITQNLTHGLAETRGQLQIIGRELLAEDRKWIKKRGLRESHFVRGLYTFMLKEQTHHYRRSEFGLPDVGTVCVVVGGRLDDEIGEEFLEVTERLSKHRIHTVFVGRFDSYSERILKYEEAKRYTHFIGYQKDTLAICECCDIYLNPLRRGGGTSAVEALYKGLPVLTPDYGDVAVNAGERFLVKDYDEMAQKVFLLAEDDEEYREWSDIAKKRAEVLLDSDREFSRIMCEAEKRQEFIYGH